ncbi:hypothetical protein ACPV36_12695 [Photobacterium damselae]|uniref:hypothetical protein n=1 Tax=Photobacterium damselae TaxID=38293 RepID=UPI004068B113
MGLDTRGVMDGALKGFELMDRHYEREDRKAAREQSLRRADERAKQEQENWNKSYELKVKQDKEQTNYNNQMLSLRQTESKQRAEMAALQAAKVKSDLARTEQLNFINDHAALLDKAWVDYDEGKQLDPIFDNKFIKGTQFDIRRYDDKALKAHRNIELGVPQVLSRSMKPDDLLEDLSVIHQDEINKIIGTKDATGTKTVKGAKLNRVVLADDIDPSREGQQPGFVFGMELTYEDKNGNITTEQKPVTDLRSSNPYDNVRVVPIESLMANIAQGSKLARYAAHKRYYNKLFHPDAAKRQRELEKEYRQYFSKVENGRAKAIAEALKSSMGEGLTEEQMAVINKPFDEQLANAQGLYAAYGMDSPIGNGKQEVSTLSPEDLFKIKGDLVGHDSLKSTQFESFVKWVSDQGANVNYALKDKETAKTLFESYLKTMKDKTVEDNFNYAVAEGEKRQGNKGATNYAPPPLRSASEAMNDTNAMMAFTNGLTGKDKAKFSDDVLPLNSAITGAAQSLRETVGKQYQEDAANARLVVPHRTY